MRISVLLVVASALLAGCTERVRCPPGTFFRQLPDGTRESSCNGRFDVGVEDATDGGDTSVDTPPDPCLVCGTTHCIRLDGGVSNDAARDASTSPVKCGCENDTHCTGNLHCDTDTNECVECVNDTHCPTAPSRTCDTSIHQCRADSGVLCVPCTSDARCRPGYRCGAQTLTGAASPLGNFCFPMPMNDICNMSAAPVLTATTTVSGERNVSLCLPRSDIGCPALLEYDNPAPRMCQPPPSENTGNCGTSAQEANVVCRTIQNEGRCTIPCTSNGDCRTANRPNATCRMATNPDPRTPPSYCVY